MSSDNAVAVVDFTASKHPGVSGSFVFHTMMPNLEPENFGYTMSRVVDEAIDSKCWMTEAFSDKERARAWALELDQEIGTEYGARVFGSVDLDNFVNTF